MAQAFLLMPVVAASLRLFGFQKTYHWLDIPNQPLDQGNPAAVGRSVAIAAQNYPVFQPTCLSRSLVLWHLLRRRGFPAELRIGVNVTEAQFSAHAWVENKNKVINDAPDISERFSPIDISLYSPMRLE